MIDNRIKVKGALKDAIVAYLNEAGGELEAQVQRNSRVDTGQTKGSYSYVVDKSAQECSVGSPLENAIWEELGTGEFALNGDGRKGGWTYQDKKTGQFYHTKGKSPNRPLQRAHDQLKNKLISRAQTVIGGKME